jgi:hypothetical protein
MGVGTFKVGANSSQAFPPRLSNAESNDCGSNTLFEVTPWEYSDENTKSTPLWYSHVKALAAYQGTHRKILAPLVSGASIRISRLSFLYDRL